MKARVYITLRKEVLDPEGKAIAQALRSLGFAGVGEVRTGKYMEIQLEGEASSAEARIKGMCDKLLANPVIEDYRFDFEGL